MSLRHAFENLAWRFAGFSRTGIVYKSSRIRERPAPYCLVPVVGERFVVFSPHPDDEVIGCGGLILKALHAGSQVDIVYVTDGALGGDAKMRKREADEISVLCRTKTGRGVRSHFLNMKELQLNSKVLSEKFAAILHEVKPGYVFFPHANDGHKDHVAVNYALKAVSCTKAVGRGVKFFGYEIWDTLTPAVFVDISDFIDDKKELIAAYRSQKRDFLYEDMIIALNTYRAGGMPGPSTCAEAFSIEISHVG